MKKWIWKIYLKNGTGEISMELIIFHGLETNTFPPIVDPAGLMVPPAPLLIESISWETILGLIWTYLLKSLSTVKLEAHAMVETLDKSMSTLITTVSLKKLVRLILPRILNNLVAQISKDVKIVLLQLELNQGIRVTAGLNPNIQFGKLMSMELFQELRKWKLKSTREVPFHAESMPQKN